MRNQEQILQDMDEAYHEYFNVLGNHAPFMEVLTRLRQLEQELIEVVGNRHEAYHLEHVSYMSAMDEFMSTPRKSKNRENYTRFPEII